MATYFVASGGSNTAPYDTWAKAATSLQTALTAASTAGDIVVIQHDAVPSTDKELAADTTYTIAANVFLVSASNNGGSAYTPTAMGTSNWIGNSTTNRGITFAGTDFSLSAYGLTLRTAGSTGDEITLTSSVGMYSTWESCYFWSGNTSSTVRINIGQNATAGAQSTTEFINCTLRFGATGQGIRATHSASFVNCTISTDGSAPSTLFPAGSSGSAVIEMIGCDLSHVTGTLVGDLTARIQVNFERCKLGSGVVPLAAQTSNPTSASGKVFLFDCSSGDTHGVFGYYDAFGSILTNTTVKFTSGAAGASWQVATTSLCNKLTPFVTPWIDYYNTTTTSITPYIEILRDDSTSAYTDQEVWAEFSVKTDSGSPRAATLSNDRDTLADYLLGTSASNQEAGAGLGSWTGESGTAWSGKLTAPSSVTPTDPGALRARVYCTLTSSTNDLYIDPQIRT